MSHWLRHDISPEELGAVQAHEAEHRRHMASFGTCVAFFVWLHSSPAHAVETEARAFCAAARHDVGTGRFPDIWPGGVAPRCRVPDLSRLGAGGRARGDPPALRARPGP